MRTEIIGNATLHLADCLEIIGELPRSGAAIVTDNPYGMAHDFDSRRFTGGTEAKPRGMGRADRAVDGDEEGFDPEPWLAWSEVIFWGANHFAARLPVGSTLVWLKKLPKHYGTFLSDAEIGWQKGGYGVYVFHAPDSNGRRQMEASGSAFGGTAHPTQKPNALMEWCVKRTKAPTVIDPFMGSGTTGVACFNLNRSFVGVEKDQTYFDAACRRIEAAQVQPRLFQV